MTNKRPKQKPVPVEEPQPEELLEEAPPAEAEDAEPKRESIRYLDELQSATCPIEGYSGLVRYPAIMDLPRYRLYRQVIADSEENDGQMTLAFVEHDDGKIVPIWFSVLYYKLALTLATEISVTGPDTTNVREIETIPVNLIAWLSLTAKEWLDSQLTFRVSHR